MQEDGKKKKIYFAWEPSALEYWYKAVKVSVEFGLESILTKIEDSKHSAYYAQIYSENHWNQSSFLRNFDTAGSSIIDSSDDHYIARLQKLVFIINFPF